MFHNWWQRTVVQICKLCFSSVISVPGNFVLKVFTQRSVLTFCLAARARTPIHRRVRTIITQWSGPGLQHPLMAGHLHDDSMYSIYKLPVLHVKHRHIFPPWRSHSRYVYLSQLLGWRNWQNFVIFNKSKIAYLA